MSKIFIRFIYLQGFCEAAVSNAHLRWIGGDGWWFSGHWDITNTSEEEGLSLAKCGESRGNQGNRLQRWMAISNNIQSWISRSVLAGGNLESGNILVLNIWSGLVYLWHLVGFVLRLWVRQENCYLGTFYNLWPRTRLWRTLKSEELRQLWHSRDIENTERRVVTKYGSAPKYFIKIRQNWNIGSVRAQRRDAQCLFV